MRHAWLVPVITFLTLNIIAVSTASEGESGSGFDKVWDYATLYENQDNRYIRKFALSGRLQADAAWFDADQGDFDDILWRRFRFGFKADLFRNWVVQLEGDFNLNNKLEEWYNRLTDAYIGWSPNKNLTIKAPK